jgi:uncharacterized lipoprotein (TIGR02269 family)
MARPPRLWLLGLWVLLAACASPGSALREEGEEAVSSWEEACEDARSLVFLCGEEACGFYRCRDVVPGRIVRTFSGAPVAPPPLRAPGPGAMRYWGSAQGLPRDARPVFIIPWYTYAPERLLPALSEQQRKEAEALAKRPREKHHIFPQAFKKWFKEQGINVHEWTLVIYKDDHDRIHRGAKGGPWNDAWRHFIATHDETTKEAIWLHAGELIHRFGLYGPTASYWRDLPALRTPQQP